MKVLIFDFDGTLFDSREDIAAAVNYARKHFGLSELALDEVTAMVGNGVDVLAQRAFRDTHVNPNDGLSVLGDYYRAHPAEKTVLYPGVLETLHQIKDVRTIVSNKPKALVEAVLVKQNLLSLFDYVAGGDTFTEKKPSPVGVEFVRERYGVSKDSILVIGDHSPDIEMAKRSGVRSVYCRYGFFGNDTVGADYEINTFSDLLPVLTQWRQLSP
jgi:phosphoglycolate phosphatase